MIDLPSSTGITSLFGSEEIDTNLCISFSNTNFCDFKAVTRTGLEAIHISNLLRAVVLESSNH